MSEQRLIDANALKERVNRTIDYAIDEFDKGYNIGIQKAVELIDNAPTVEQEITNEDLQLAMTESHKLGYEMAKARYARPQGEWEWVQYDANPNIGNWHCSECHYIPQGKKEYQKTNFCPNCGAEMRGKEE